jgi:glutamate 5-kinase
VAAVRPGLSHARRIVVKIGSSTLVDAGTGQIRDAWFGAFAKDVQDLRTAGKQIILVSSGAIALGRRTLSLPPGALRLDQAQAAAAVGQIGLAAAWSAGLKTLGVTVAQVLLTYEDTEERRRYLNARATLNTLLGLGAVPVINENDTVATAEIRYGDNDRLAARVAAMMEADALVLLSDIDGLYTADPRKDTSAKLISIVDAVTPDIEAAAGGVGSAMGSGGMATKILAAKLATGAGCHMAIARGDVLGPLSAMEHEGKATWFRAAASPQAARKTWIAGALKPQGQLTIDAGAVNALQSGKSLLPAGVVAIAGDFERGDCVTVADLNGLELGRGLVAYDAEDAKKIMGRRSGEIESLLGIRGRDEMIHRDDFVLKVR